MALEIDRVDFLHEITIKSDRAYLHFDFELKHSSHFPRRVHVYHGMLTELKKPTPVISIPIYLKPRKTNVPNFYDVKVGGHLFHRFSYQPIQLWEHLDEIRSGKLYTLAPLLILLSENPTEETLLEERELIFTHEPDLNRRHTLLRTAILVALGQQIFDPDFLWDFFKEQDMLLADDPFIKRLFNELYGTKLANAEAEVKAEAQAQVAEARQHAHKMEIAFHQALAAQREAEAKAEAAQREAEAAQQEAEAKAEAAQREAEAKVEAARREAEAKAEAEARAKWLEAVSEFLSGRFTTIPVEILQDLQRLSVQQNSEVTNLVLDAPDLATFEQELKAMVSDQS